MKKRVEAFGHHDGDGCAFPQTGHLVAESSSFANPVLSIFRDEPFMDLEATLDHTNLEWMTDLDANPEQVAFARRVLTRLAAVSTSTESETHYPKDGK